MCYKGKFIYCIPVKTACFVLAIINAIANALSLVWFSLIGIGALIAALINNGDSISKKIDSIRFKRGAVDVVDEVIFDYWIPFEYLLPICGLFSLLTFIFSVWLCLGIHKHRYRLVKAYFVYGCVITVLAFLASMIQIIVKEKPHLGMWGLMGCALHSLFLVLVYYTHDKMVEDAMLTDHIPLNDEDIANALSLVWFSLIGIGALIAALINNGDSISKKIDSIRFKRGAVDVVDEVIFDYWIPFEYLLPICGLFSLLTFIFSVWLCLGIHKHRYRLVKAYFVYGCVITVLAFLASMIQIIVKEKPHLGMWGLMGCALHSLFLVLVYYTHDKMVEDAMLTDHIPLNDEDVRDLF